VILLHPNDYPIVTARAEADGISVHEAYIRIGVETLKALAPGGYFEVAP
jgi:hypothetical protein